MKNSLQLPSGYHELLQELKTRIRGAQVRAAFAVTRELVLLYWSIGREISQRFDREDWGGKIVDRLSKDLQAEFPGVEGFSPRSLRYMRTFAEAWPDEPILQQLAAKLPWGHHMVLLDRVKEGETREWYLRAALENGWSRNVLVHMISGQLREREGKALTNFQRELPPRESDLAEQILKDPYNFDFLTVTTAAKEREIENGLLSHLRDLLLELGRGFSFVGSQVPLTVDDRTFYIDLLFYHVRLHRYFVFELKVGDFEPEYAGKLSFYLAAVNRTLRTPVEGPSIGVLLCESRSGPMVEFALENINQPIGVSTYRVTRELPAPIQDELPTVEDLQEVVNKLRTEIETLRREPSNGE
ncbi:PDDEXK nuclease domain-containing protein [Tunturibacter empetritectus]|uniref:Nuclease of restriction endonuclease-like (RecB) superfamily n=1 Tax=Tunturiibacter lichenicola TaxID=2051959 RepID=A0A7W8N616_9BACT|nr:PDDEXK nuclease domain-containing protein [Edaphobacter lichenicola]MBB5346158.1 putative nuclease of restriction endonuclease-like (RecB) superfamily [Edaphobacter lichenicola]